MICLAIRTFTFGNLSYAPSLKRIDTVPTFSKVSSNSKNNVTLSVLDTSSKKTNTNPSGIFKNRKILLKDSLPSGLKIRYTHADSLRLKIKYTHADSLRLKIIKKDSVRLKSAEGEIRSEVQYTSKDSTIFDLDGKKVYLYKDAVVKYDDITLKAGYVQMDQGDLTIYATGIYDTAHAYIQKPEITQGKEKITSDSIRYNFKTKKSVAWEGVSGQGGGFIRGAKVKLDENKQGFLKSGIYTTCNLDHPHYGIKITKAKINATTIVTGPVYFFIEDVPLYLPIPFGFFPKSDERSNGILFPRVGEDQTLGFFLQDFGYYQGLGENFDATIKASVYTKGSFGFDIYSRYNFIYKSTGTLSFHFFNRKIGDQGTSDFSQSKDFNLTWSHSQSEKAHPGSTFSASVNAASNSYFQNSTTSPQSYLPQVRAQNAIGSSINYSKTWDGSPFSVNIGLTHSQNLEAQTLSLTFPTINASLTRINPFDSKERVGIQKWYQKIGFSYTFQGQNALNTTTSALSSPGLFKKLQNGILHQPTLTLGTYNILKHILITPSISYTERWYFQTYRQNYNFTTGSVNTDTVQGFKAERDFSFSLGTDTRIYGMLLFPHGTIRAIRHVFEPNISFSYTPDFTKISPNNYGSYRNFSTGQTVTYSIFQGGLYGGGPNALSESINFGFNNTLEMKVKSGKDTLTGEQKIPILEHLSFNASYNLAADSFRLSNVNFSGSTTLFKKLGINFSGVLDPYSYDNYGNRLKTFLYTTRAKLVRLTSFNLSFNLSLNSNSKNGSTQKTQPQPKPQVNTGFNTLKPTSDFVDFSIPWDLNMNYNFSYNLGPGSVFAGTTKTITRSNIVNMSGNLTFTPKWKIGFTTGADFEQKVITSTQFTIFRDLHCWQLSGSWSPFGSQKFYSIELRIASGLLSEIKVDKHKDYYNTY